MKTKLILLLTVTILSFHFSYSQNTPSIKERITGKWIYEGAEEFGVVTLDSLHSKDWIEFNSDGSFNQTYNGNKVSGTYKITESTKQVFMTDAVTKKTMMYKVKRLTPTELTLDFQTPDLVHTLYKFRKQE